MVDSIKNGLKIRLFVRNIDRIEEGKCTLSIKGVNESYMFIQYLFFWGGGGMMHIYTFIVSLEKVHVPIVVDPPHRGSYGT